MNKILQENKQLASKYLCEPTTDANIVGQNGAKPMLNDIRRKTDALMDLFIF